MGIDPTEICFSVPGEQMPTLSEVLKLYREWGKEIFKEAPPNERRDFVRVSYDKHHHALARIDHEEGEKIFSAEDKEKQYIPWKERKTKKAKSSWVSAI